MNESGHSHAPLRAPDRQAAGAASSSRDSFIVDDDARFSIPSRNRAPTREPLARFVERAYANSMSVRIAAQGLVVAGLSLMPI